MPQTFIFGLAVASANLIAEQYGAHYASARGDGVDRRLIQAIVAQSRLLIADADRLIARCKLPKLEPLPK